VAAVPCLTDTPLSRCHLGCVTSFGTALRDVVLSRIECGFGGFYASASWYPYQQMQKVVARPRRS
jgi:hypothetical protein